MDSETLNSLIDRCKSGQAGAFDELVDRYGNRCFGFFYRLSGNRGIAEDLLSELFVKLVTKIGSFDGGSFEQWLFTIAGNIFKDYLRSRYRQQRLLEIKSLEIATESPPDSNDLSDQLQHVLGQLDPETSELIMLRFYAELSFKEIAEIRKEPIGTTLCKVHRGLKKLRELMVASLK